VPQPQPPCRRQVILYACWLIYVNVKKYQQPWIRWGHSHLEFVPWRPLLSPSEIRMSGLPSTTAHRWGTRVCFQINTHMLPWPLCWHPTQCHRRSCGRFSDWSCTLLLVHLDHPI
jgi:hypothetical protein